MKYLVEIITPTRKGAWGSPPELRLRITGPDGETVQTEGMAPALAHAIKTDLEKAEE